MATEKPKTKIIERREVIVTLPVVKAPRWMQGFVDFVREQGVVGLAVGLTLGIASKGVVDSLVENIFNPLLGVLAGGESLASKFVCLKQVNGACASKIGYGQVMSDLLSFMIVVALVYFLVKGLKLDKLDKKKAE